MDHYFKFNISHFIEKQKIKCNSKSYQAFKGDLGLKKTTLWEKIKKCTKSDICFKIQSQLA